MQKSRYTVELRSAIIAGIVAVLVAAPLSDAAYTQASHIVKTVKGERGKTGKRGPRGFAGATGATGAVGPMGRAGRDAPEPDPSKLTSTVGLMPGETKTAGDECPSGEHATSGYNSPADDSSGPTVIRDGVTPDGSFYFVVARNDGNTFTAISADAVCVSG